MKLTLNNIGPIHQFEFDLDKDIHLIYGKNNVGKSYAVNFLYCFLKALDDIDIYQFRYKYRNLSLAKSHEDYIADIYTQIWKRLIEPKFEEYLKSTFSSILNLQNKRNRFESIIVFEDDKVILEVVLKDSQFTIDRISVKSSMNAFSSYEYKKIWNEIKQNISNYFFDFSNAYFLPASKSGLYAPMSGMGEIIADLSQYRDRTNLKIDLAPLTKPVADYYKQLINSTDFDPPLRRNNYIDKAEEIEEEILGGKIRINKNRKVVFSDNNSDLNLEIVYTASMIAELAPLVLYLKNAINQSPGNPILIIEEPEAHLHPEVQVKLMEIFVELAKQNVKIIMTSHSNYMFNKLSNLLLEKKIEPEKVGIYHMEMTDKGSIVKDDMSATSEGIEDNNFATVAEKLYNERLAIYHQLNEDQNAYNTTEK